MKKTVYQMLSASFLLTIPTAALANTLVDSTTILRFSQDDRPGFAKKTLAPATEFAGIDADHLADGNLSLHVYGWGRVDLGDKSFNSNQADGSLTYGYLQYRFGQANAQARAGRFFVNEGIINEQVDGVSARTDLPYGFGISGFGGATVHTANVAGEHTDGKGDGIFGGRVNYRYKGMLEVGLSGLYETNVPTLSNPANIALLGTDRLGNHRWMGGDIWFSPFRMVSVTGHTIYNTETEEIAEHSYLLNIKPTKALLVSGEFNQHKERDFFFSSPMFASMVTDPNELSRSEGAKVTYEVKEGVEVTANYKHYSRDFGEADRIGGDLRLNMLNNTLRSGLSYYYLAADSGFAVIPASNASGSYHMVRGWTMHDSKSYFSSLDFIDYIFKERIDNGKDAWQLTGSLGYHLTPALALSGDLSYGENPLYSSDMRGLLRLTYNMNFNDKGGAK